jgi:hypothetical protein
MQAAEVAENGASAEEEEEGDGGVGSEVEEEEQAEEQAEEGVDGESQGDRRSEEGGIAEGEHAGSFEEQQHQGPTSSDAGGRLSTDQQAAKRARSSQ